MSSNPLTDGLRRWRPTADWCCLADSRVPAQACVRRCERWPGWSGGSRQWRYSALEVAGSHEMRYTNRRLIFFTLTWFTRPQTITHPSSNLVSINYVGGSQRSTNHYTIRHHPGLHFTLNKVLCEYHVKRRDFAATGVAFWTRTNAVLRVDFTGQLAAISVPITACPSRNNLIDLALQHTGSLP